MNENSRLSKLKWTLHRFWILKHWKRPNAKKVTKAFQEFGPILGGKLTQQGLEEARKLLWGKD